MPVGFVPEPARQLQEVGHRKHARHGRRPGVADQVETLDGCQRFGGCAEERCEECPPVPHTVETVPALVRHDPVRLARKGDALFRGREKDVAANDVVVHSGAIGDRNLPGGFRVVAIGQISERAFG